MRMNKSDNVQGFTVDPDTLIAMLKSMNGEEADRLRTISAESIEGMIKSLSGIRYDIKVEVNPHWVTRPANQMESMIQAKHREEIADSAVPYMVKALNDLAAQLDIAAIERYYDLLQKLKGGDK